MCVSKATILAGGLGKTERLGGEPIDAMVVILAAQKAAVQSFAGPSHTNMHTNWRISMLLVAKKPGSASHSGFW